MNTHSIPLGPVPERVEGALFASGVTTWTLTAANEGLWTAPVTLFCGDETSGLSIEAEISEDLTTATWVISDTLAKEVRKHDRLSIFNGGDSVDGAVVAAGRIIKVPLHGSM